MSSEEYNPNSVDAVLSRIEERQKTDSKKLDSIIANHEARIGKLEAWRYYLIGAFTLAGIGAKAAWDWARNKI